MFCALNPMVAAMLGIVFLHEPFTVRTVAGGLLILTGILLAELPDQVIRQIPFPRFFCLTPVPSRSVSSAEK